MNAKVQAAKLSVVSNTFLVVGKLIVGLAIGSVSVISEGIHSSLDLLAAIIAYFAVKVAAHPADEKHRYGHGKVENVSGTFEALLIFVAAIWIIYEGTMRLLEPHPVGDVGWGIAVMVVSATVNFFISRHLMKVGKETDSIALQTDGLHLLTDVYTAAGVAIGLVGLYLTGWQWIDPAAAIFVALIIIKAAWDMTKEAFMPLIDASLSDEDEERIKGHIDEHGERFMEFHDLRTRKAGSEQHMDFHMTVCRYHTVEAAHGIADDIEGSIKNSFPYANILIHQEPCDKECAGCKFEQKAS